MRVPPGTLNADTCARTEEEPLAPSAALPWRWRNLRSIGLAVQFWPLDWEWGIDNASDAYGGRAEVFVGPLGVIIDYSIGGQSNPFRLSAERVVAPVEASPLPTEREGSRDAVNPSLKEV